MRFIVIQSGSKGNATLVIDKGRVLLIDMGIGLRVLKEALYKENLNLDSSRIYPSIICSSLSVLAALYVI